MGSPSKLKPRADRVDPTKVNQPFDEHNSASGLSASTVALEQRAEGRDASARTVEVRLVTPNSATADGGFRRARLIDCSAHGIGLLVDFPVPVCSDLTVKLTVRGQEKLVAYSIRHSSAIDAGRCHVGGELIDAAGVEPVEIVGSLLASE